jgi:outer membrane protein assembly factor BamE (lipoprotein component of BamABCDE complex)
MKRITLYSLCALLLCSCTAAQHHNTLHTTKENKLTVGKVQKFIKKGMNAAEVAEIMGSPNIVTSNGNSGETWIYDKIATEVSYSKSSQGADIMVLGLGAIVGLGGGNINSQSGASSQSQKTLTVIINFINNQVSDFKYHTSSF